MLIFAPIQGQAAGGGGAAYQPGRHILKDAAVVPWRAWTWVNWNNCQALGVSVKEREPLLLSIWTDPGMGIHEAVCCGE